MLVIRLRRVGKKNKPTYRVVVAEHSYPVNGKFTADLGHYNPHTKTVGLDKAEIKIWMDKGAKPSNTVAKLLEKEKVSHKQVVVVKKNKQSKKTEAKEPATKAQAEPAVQPQADAEEAASTESVAKETVSESDEKESAEN